MGKAHLKPYVMIIIQSARLAESEQTKVYSETHDFCGIAADLARKRTVSTRFGRD